MSLRVDITFEGEDQLAALTDALGDKAAMHGRIAKDALVFVREFGKKKAPGEHRTAGRLGARPTGHLERAYAGIESESDESQAALLVPRASRLRAAFGGYTLTPTRSKYLTLPVSKDAYGRRAREFDDLFPVRLGPRKSLFLARETEGGGLETMYFLTNSVNIKEDASLIPFREIFDGAADSVEAYLDEAIERRLA
jgi:hypothetical protein